MLHDCHIDDSATDQDLLKYYHLRLMADAGLVEETDKYGGVLRIKSWGMTSRLLPAMRGHRLRKGPL